MQPMPDYQSDITGVEHNVLKCCHKQLNVVDMSLHVLRWHSNS